MCSIKYSIIIPHKNIPQLLQRCLDSISIRNDVQVIVIDDNSDSTIVDFDNFPGKGRKDIEVYFTKENRGAGFARNIGISKAIGKWLIFMDADDLFSNHFNDILDSCPDSVDMVIYDHATVMSNNLFLKSDRDGGYYHDYIKKFLDGDISEDLLRYRFDPLWGKVIKRSIVVDNQIKFDEVKWSNDVFFSRCIGYYAKSISVFNEIFYIVTQRPGSLTSNFNSSKSEFRVRLGEAIKSESFLKKHGVYMNQLDSYSLIRVLYNTKGLKTFLSQLLSQKFLSKNQRRMIGFIFSVLKERIIFN